MPTLDQTKPYTWQRIQFSSFSPGVEVGRVTINDWLPGRYKQTPTTTYRVKPTNLWTGATSREVIQKIYNYPLGYIWTDDRRYLYAGKAICDTWNPANALSPNVQPPNRAAMHNQIRKNLRGQAANLAMVLAEYNKTAQLFSEAARIVATRGRGLGRGLAGTRQASRAVARRYLQYTYGIAPLCGDMVTSFENLKQAGISQPLVIGGKVRRVTSGSRFAEFGASDTSITGKAIGDVHIKYIYDTHWRAELNPDSLRSTLAKYGFTNPFSLAYELIPFSFVLDWWINVGDVLASLDHLILVRDLKVRDSSRVIVGRYVSVNNRNASGGGSVITITDNRGSANSISTISTLQYKPSVSYKHIMNGMALLRMAMKN